MTRSFTTALAAGLILMMGLASASASRVHHRTAKASRGGVGSGTARTTATGGNAGGYSSRN